EKPFDPGEVLLVMTTEVVDEGLDGQAAVTLEDALPTELGLAKAGDDVERRRPGGADGGEDVPGIGLPVTARAGQRLAVDRWQRRPGLGEHPAKADMIPIDLDVAHVAELPDRGETLAGNAVPGGGPPVDVLGGDVGEVQCELVGKRAQGGERGVQHA